ncbi:transcription elongation factor SPT5 [Schistocerca americana]|uniref:transcription elongation factor SPT5 n=1 Tax=Schistocerca americana TaxID=7009 RepID=UPI001F4FE764|nr:transcription elongation factor SPT5 [Schistocerca americana]XP_047105744.1 transcription elongation factor SPT5 [Schistocerca piceifrons]XP_049775829.1 transcription elongation factor SPT5 [Schistocerca cancellata]XP_049951198.1 transcription elongation factor SPT5 [Schistocerca serialis cubense]
MSDSEASSNSYNESDRGSNQGSDSEAEDARSDAGGGSDVGSGDEDDGNQSDAGNQSDVGNRSGGENDSDAEMQSDGGNQSDDNQSDAGNQSDVGNQSDAGNQSDVGNQSDGNQSDADNQSDDGNASDDDQRSERSEKSGRSRRSTRDDEAEEAGPGEEEEEVEDEQEPEGEDLNSEEEEEEDEDEYDEEEDEEEDDRPRKKKKKDRFGGFIIDEAEVDDEVEDEDEWEEGAQEIGIVGNEFDEHGPTAREIEGRRRGTNLWDSQKEDEIEEYLRKKYADESIAARHFGDGGEEMSDEITQQTLLPGVKDPNLWMVKCRIGEEKNTALLLMRKFIAYQFTNEPLQIKSVVAPEHVKGYIYIEAYKQPHVKAAIQNVGNLRMGQWQQQMVPIKEMTDVLRVVKEQIGLKPKQWVRLKRSIYRDDIAQVDYVDLAQNQVHLKLLPRIDYTRLRGALRTSQPDNDSAKRKKKVRPPAKPFDPEAIRAIGGEVTSDGDFLIFEGNRYSRKGFLYKNFTMSAIVADGVKPTLSELEKFEEAPEGIDIELPTTASKDDATTHSFSTGDNVEVCEGELMNLQGKILTIDGNMITVMPKHEALTEPLEFLASELRKYFRMGDHVKVIAGRYEGDTGLIVRVEENRVVLFSDLTMHELEVLPKDIQLSPDMATGVDSLGQYQWGDCVQLDPQTVGVIVRLERENFHVLSMQGKVVEAKPQALQKRKESRYTVALDYDQNTIQRKDIVKVIDGPHAGRDGEIKHLYRNYAFLHSRMYLDNGGIFVCKTRHLQLAGGNKNSNTSGGLDSGFPGFMSPHISSPMHPSGGARGGGARGRGRGGGMRRDRELIGQTIKITGGPYKGNVGIVKVATESTARVELHSTCQTISVDRSHIAVVGAPTRDGSFSSYSRTPAYGGGQTPVYRDGSKTPMHGSQTPIYDAGSRTPHFGGMTPSHDGSQTPGRSGAWDPTIANTPRRPNEFDSYPIDDASPSPTYNPSTPAYQPGGPLTPQTPGTMYGSDNSYSPYQPSPSPPGYRGTPSAYVATPSPSGYTPSPTSGVQYATPSPLVYSPVTPGAASPFNPHTPGSGLDQQQLQQEWHTTDIEVRIKDTHEDTGLSGQTGIITGISGGMCSVFLLQEDRTVNILAEHLEPVLPQQGDRVKVILGEEREAVGKLISIDNQDGVVKVESGDVKMLQLRFLCKLRTIH